jgi:hypothetical protein
MSRGSFEGNWYLSQFFWRAGGNLFRRDYYNRRTENGSPAKFKAKCVNMRDQSLPFKSHKLRRTLDVTPAKALRPSAPRSRLWMEVRHDILPLNAKIFK